MSPTGAPASIDTIPKAFPPVIESIVGEPTLRELIRVIDTHIVPCAQSYVTAQREIHYLYLCMPAKLWLHYMNEPCPDIPAGPDCGMVAKE